MARHGRTIQDLIAKITFPGGPRFAHNGTSIKTNRWQQRAILAATKFNRKSGKAQPSDRYHQLTQFSIQTARFIVPIPSVYLLCFNNPLGLRQPEVPVSTKQELRQNLLKIPARFERAITLGEQGARGHGGHSLKIVRGRWVRSCRIVKRS